MVHCILQLKSTFKIYIRYRFRRFLLFCSFQFVPFVPHILFKTQQTKNIGGRQVCHLIEMASHESIHVLVN